MKITDTHGTSASHFDYLEAEPETAEQPRRSRTLPQYARSTDPDVIAAIERNAQHERDFHEAIQALSTKYTGAPDNAWYNRSGHGSILIGLRMTREQIEAAGGRWTKPSSRGAVRPYRSDLLSEEFELRAEHETVPGRPDVMWGEGSIGGGAIFVHDGAAWSGFSFAPIDETDGRGGWTEVLASEFRAALDAVNAR